MTIDMIERCRIIAKDPERARLDEIRWMAEFISGQETRSFVKEVVRQREEIDRWRDECKEGGPHRLDGDYPRRSR